jgi:hypothetical protein
MSREEGVLSIANPPFYLSRRSFDCLAARARGYLGEAGNNAQETPREAPARQRITTMSPGDTR